MLARQSPAGQPTTRRTAREIFHGVEKNARDELHRSTRALAFSGLAGGLSMGLTGIAVAGATAALDGVPGRGFLAYVLFPVGFIAVIIGRAQLFTENTLYPVALVLSERRHLANTARLWSVVFVSNVLGAIAFAGLAIGSDALTADAHNALIQLGTAAVQRTGSQIFWSAVIGGWIIALVAWLVTASHWTIGQIAVVWLLTFLVGVGHFAHCIAGTGEIMSAVIAGAVSFSRYLQWLALATAGNIFGGVTLVTLLNFGQVKLEEV